MKNFKIQFTYLIALLSIFSTYSLSAHYGPRGLLGGTPHVGIQFNGIVYLGTEDAGVFESTNALLVGWRLRAVGLKSGEITALTHSGAELYAATADSGIFIFNGAQGTDLYWNKRNNGLGSLNILSILAVDANTLYAGTDGSGLYKTTDKGLNWAAVSSASLNGKDITALTKGGSRLFALVRDGGVFASDDNGATWFSLNDANTLNKTATECFTYNAANNQLLVSNVTGLWILASASTTMAPAYAAASTGLPNPIHVHNLANNGTKWLLASHSGVFQTPVSSVSWIAANTGLPNTDVETIVAIDDTLVVGMGKMGVYKSNANTINWVVNNTGMTNINTNSIACKGDSLVVTATEYGVTVSTNIGNNPVISNNGLTDSLSVNDVEIGGNMFFAATTNSGVFVSSNMGQSWSAQNSGLTNMNISRVIYGNDRIYAIDDDGKLFQSNVSTISWTLATTGLPTNTAATSLAFYANMLVLGTYGNGVFVKHRDSSAWTAFNTGLSNMDVTSVTYSANKLYAGTDGSGVFVSDASTAGWAVTSTISIPHLNFVPLDVSHIQYMTTIREYVVATYRGGIVGTTDGGATWVPAGNQNNLPSYADIYKVSYVTSRVFLTTPTNNAQSGGTSELEKEDSLLVVNTTMVNAPASATESYHSITSNMKWKATSSDSWVTLSADSGLWNGNLRLTIAANTGASMRMATVTVKGDTITRTIMVHQQGTTGVAANSLNDDVIKLYPNPNNGQFAIDISGYNNVNSISILDLSGRRLKEVAIQNKSVIFVSENLLPGVYSVEIQSAKGKVVKRLLVE